MPDDRDEKDGEQGGAGDQRGLPPEGESEVDEERPRITLDRYLGQRRQSWSVLHLVTVVFMLAALVMLVLYKDRCGRTVSDVIYYTHGPDRGTPSGRIKLDPPQSQPGQRR